MAKPLPLTPRPVASSCGTSPITSGPPLSLRAARSPIRWLSASGDAQLWNIATRQRTIIPLSIGVDSVAAFGPGGTVLAFVDGYTLQLWDTATSQQITTLITTSDQNPGPAEVTISPDGTLMAVTTGNARGHRDPPSATDPG